MTKAYEKLGQAGGGAIEEGYNITPHPERRVRHRPADAGHLPAHAGGGAASDLPLRPRAGDGA